MLFSEAVGREAEFGLGAEATPSYAGGRWQPSVLDCLRVIFEEEWHHHRYAVRDLDVIDTRRACALLCKPADVVLVRTDPHARTTPRTEWLPRRLAQ